MKKISTVIKHYDGEVYKVTYYHDGKYDFVDFAKIFKLKTNLLGIKRFKKVLYIGNLSVPYRYSNSKYAEIVRDTYPSEYKSDKYKVPLAVKDVESKENIKKVSLYFLHKFEPLLSKR